jgi:DNA-binding NtrC family response regulator
MASLKGRDYSRTMNGHEIFKTRRTRGHRILVVEEANDISRLNAEVLIDAGYQVKVAEDGAAAWGALLLHKYDLLLTDQFPLKMSVEELLRKIHAANMVFPIIMATSILPAWEFALHPRLQAVTMLRKPHTFEKLLGLVNNILHPNAGAPAEARPAPNWQSQVSAGQNCGSDEQCPLRTHMGETPYSSQMPLHLI